MIDGSAVTCSLRLLQPHSVNSFSYSVSSSLGLLRSEIAMPLDADTIRQHQAHAERPGQRDDAATVVPSNRLITL